MSRANTERGSCQSEHGPKEPDACGCEDVIEAFLREGTDATPERVRLWTARHPRHRADLLRVAGRLALGTVLDVRRDIPASERAEIRRWAVARANALAAGSGDGSPADQRPNHAGRQQPRSRVLPAGGERKGR